MLNRWGCPEDELLTPTECSAQTRSHPGSSGILGVLHQPRVPSSFLCPPLSLLTSLCRLCCFCLQLTQLKGLRVTAALLLKPFLWYPIEWQPIVGMHFTSWPCTLHCITNVCSWCIYIYILYTCYQDNSQFWEAFHFWNEGPIKLVETLKLHGREKKNASSIFKLFIPLKQLWSVSVYVRICFPIPVFERPQPCRWVLRWGCGFSNKVLKPI